MNKVLVTSSLLLISLPFFADSQVPSNEWINPNQTYLKFKVGEKGVYKITFKSIDQKTSINPSTIDPNNFQLFNMGKEQPIRIQTGGDNSFDQGDHIIFLGEKNDGALDSGLYKNPEDQPHKFSSLYTDSASYFLTWKQGANGKRYKTIKNTNYANYNPEKYFIKTGLTLTNRNYTIQKDYRSGFSNVENAGVFGNSHYTTGEGWSVEYTPYIDRNFSINTENFYQAGPQPKAELLLFSPEKNGFYEDNSGERYNHRTEIRVNGGQVKHNVWHKSFQYKLETFPLNQKALKNKKTKFNIKRTPRFQSPGNIGYGRCYIFYIKLKYPKTFELGGTLPFSFAFNKKNNGQYLVEFPGYPSNLNKPLIFDKANQAIVKGTLAQNKFKALIPAIVGKQDLLLTDENKLTKVDPVKVEMKNFDQKIPEDLEYLIITNKKLKKVAQQYANYRSRDYTVNKVYVSDLFNQFSYGIHHPLSIRYFMKSLAKRSKLPDYLLLLGNGLSNKHVRRENLINEDLVPAIGNPPSDNLFVYNLKKFNQKTTNIPVAVGRIPATDNQKALNYFNKLTAYENQIKTKQEGLKWRKNLMHIAGGKGKGLNERIKTYLRNYADIARDTNFGANIYNLSKSKSFPVDKTLKADFIEKLNNGLQMVNYFGHGAAEKLEVDIGEPEAYTQNKANYPIFYFSGCILGDSYNPSPKMVDRFIMSKKGGIAWLAESHFSFPSFLQPYTRDFYKNLFQKKYGQNLGDILLGTINDFKHDGGSSRYHIQNENQIFQKTLQGDPALKLYSPKKPDYETNKAQIKFIPSNPNTSMDSFGLSIITSNLGRAVNDSFSIRVKQTFADFSSKVYDSFKIKAPYFSDTTVIYIKPNSKFKGKNKFKITLDPKKKIREISESNNTAIIEKFFPSKGVSPISPREFGIVPQKNVRLKAQANNLFLNQATYEFEIDTTPSFSSPYKKSSGPIKDGSFVGWNTRLLNKDSTVYFWRVRLKGNNGNNAWETSSFIYIKGSPSGWAQGNYYQILGSKTRDMTIDTGSRILNFNRQVRGRYKTNVRPQGITFRYENRGSQLLYYGGPKNGVLVLAIEPDQVERFYYESPYNKLSNVGDKDGHNKKYTGVFTFDWTKNNGEIDTAVVKDFLNHLDSIPNGYKILLSTRNEHQFENLWGEVYRKIENLGGDQIRQIKNGWPYILKGEKGEAIGSTSEKLPDTSISTQPSNQNLSTTLQMAPIQPFGQVTSTLIGPSKNWQEATLQTSPLESPSDDSASFSIIGVKKNGDEETLKTDLPTGSHSIEDINAEQYPFLKLKADFFDSTNVTPPKLANWIVLYEFVPEGTIQPNLAFNFYKDTLQQGDSLRFKTAYQNISQFAMDSVLWKHKILDDNRNQVFNVSKTHNPLDPKDSIIDGKKWPTNNLSGSYTIRSTVNPELDQPEQYLFNNVITRDFYVKKDKTDPAIDVTFNGRHIMDGAIVSPQPKIRIKAEDDNNYLLLNDTAQIKVLLKKPGGKEQKLDYQEDLDFYPAENGKQNKATVMYEPQKSLKNGDYELKIQAKDETGNRSGNRLYQKQFKVINESTITNFYPYPNPFTSRMRFVFTLTGSQVPDKINIQIMTIRGKVIKEITKDELGPLNIGVNKTNYVWHGKDEFGDPVGNGVYFYKVKAYLNGESIDHRKTAGDQFFEKNIGKLYLMR